MKQCIRYPEMAYDICSFLAERYPKHGIFYLQAYARL